MKGLNNYISESVNKITDAELLQDYELAGTGTLADKKMLQQKYNLSSKKADDIKKACLLKLRENRHNKKKFTGVDVQSFYKLGIPLIYNKFVLVAKEEPVEFMKFYMDYEFQNIKKNGAEKIYMYCNQSNYRMSYSLRNICKRYMFTKQYLEEECGIKDKSNEDIELEALKSVLVNDMKEFHDRMMKDIEVFSKRKWKTINDTIPDIREKTQYAKQTYFAASKESCGFWNSGAAHTDKAKYKELSNKTDKLKTEYEKISNKLNSLMAIVRRYGTEKGYIDDALKQAERYYNSNINEIVHRIKSYGLNPSTAKVERVQDDPKFFELLISDNANKKLYCRSIKAAENSLLVTPHLRFIITTRK